MIKIFAYCYEEEEQKGTLHDFVRVCASTHYLTDEYGMVICQGDVEYISNRLKWFENNPLKYYDIRNKIEKLKSNTPATFDSEYKMEFII